MKKFAVKTKKYHDIFIFHALPNEQTTFQWYITEDGSQKGEKIIGQRYESYTLTGELIKKYGYDGKYLYCEYLDKETGEYLKTEFIKLHSTLNEMILAGVIFDDISETDELGNII